MRYLHLILILFILLWLSPGGALAGERSVPGWIKADPAKKSVVIEIEGAYNTTNGPFNFNGYGKGDMTIVIPADWKVKMKFVTLDANYPHSAVLSKAVGIDQLPQKVGSEDAAIPRAYTDNPVGGILNAKDGFRISANPENEGDYYLICGVTGHALAGMWVKWKFSSKARTPHIIVDKKPKNPGRP